MKLSIFLAAATLLAAPLSAQQGGFLGVSLSSGEEGGAVITEVHEGTAASVAGLKAGDVVVAVDSTKVKSVEHLIAAVGAKLPGDYLKLTVRRKGEVIQKGVILGRRPKNLGQAPDQRLPGRAPQSDRAIQWHDGEGDIEIELDDLEDHMERLHEHLQELDSDAPRIRFRGQSGQQGRMLELDDLDGLEGLLEMHDLDLDHMDGDFRIMLRDGEGLKALKGLKGHEGLKGLEGLEGLEGIHVLKGHDGNTFKFRMGDGEGHQRFEMPDFDGEHGGAMRFEIHTESEGGNVEDFLENLQFDFDVDSDEGHDVKIVLPGNLSESAKKRIHKQLTEKFGKGADVQFKGDGFKAVIKGGGDSDLMFFDGDDFDVQFDEPFEIDIEEIDGDGDLRALFHEAKDGEPKSRGARKAKSSSHDGAGKANDVAFYHDLDEAYRASRASGKPVLLDFYADWCGPCRRFGAEVLSNSDHKDLVSQFVVAKINVDENGAIAEKFGVQGIPDVRILDGEGNELMKIVGYGGEDNSRRQLKEALAKAANKAAGSLGDVRKRVELKARIAQLRKQIAEAEAQLASPHNDEF